MALVLGILRTQRKQNYFENEINDSYSELILKDEVFSIKFHSHMAMPKQINELLGIRLHAKLYYSKMLQCPMD